MPKCRFYLIPAYEQNHIRIFPCMDRIADAGRKMRIRESPWVYNMDSVEYRHLYQTIIFTMVRSMAKAMLTNLLTVPWYGNFLLLSTNWPILIIWVRHVPWYAYFFPKSASRDKKYQVFFIGPVGCQCKWRGQEFILNETVFLGSKQSWSGMKNVPLNN